MNKYLLTIFLISVIIYSHWYAYQQGLIQGEINYKKSIHMQLTLESAYNYGYVDGKRNCK